MKRSIGLNRLFLVGLVAAVAVSGLAQLAHAEPAAPSVPTAIEVPEGNKLFLVGHAVGVQIYSCDAIEGGYRWNFVAPLADVLDARGKVIMTHFGGPTWLAKDGSKVIGQVVDRATVDAAAIAWLKLSATSTAGADGDRLAGTTFIQRIATVGGVAPEAASCNAGTAGSKAEVPYTADYYFWKAA